MDNEVARACWAVGDWDRLVPFLTSVARAAVAQRNIGWHYSGDEVDDFVQLAVVRCWTRDGDAPTAPAHFVVRVVRNIIADHAKSHAVRFAADLEAGLVVPDISQHAPLTRLAWQDDRQALAVAIDALSSPRMRECVTRYLAGDSMRTIADATHTTEGAVKMTMLRARETLREALREPALNDLRITVHGKHRATVELRLFRFSRHGQWSRTGTLNVPVDHWVRDLRPLFVAGAEVAGVPLRIDETHAGQVLEAAA